ncbi:uncharacterized protein LOC135961323 [Calliphora vicina]|uniref:uncharacterized protein LOC135961323 n=1 Tax=Calliphora vicina TaxID=7373 RepID=UPI00325A963D
MAPQNIVEFVILKLTFYRFLNPESPRISLTRKKHSPSGSMTQVGDWFDRIMSKEKSSIPSTVSVRYCEWNIASGNANLFTINDYRFDKILLILGEECVHWMYYKDMCPNRRIEGFGPLSVNYCGCCLNTQYMQIMESVKGCVMKKDVCN